MRRRIASLTTSWSRGAGRADPLVAFNPAVSRFPLRINPQCSRILCCDMTALPDVRSEHARTSKHHANSTEGDEHRARTASRYIERRHLATIVVLHSRRGGLVTLVRMRIGLVLSQLLARTFGFTGFCGRYCRTIEESSRASTTVYLPADPGPSVTVVCACPGSRDVDLHTLPAGSCCPHPSCLPVDYAAIGRRHACCLGAGDSSGPRCRAARPAQSGSMQ